jgi:hypothetical protein
MKHVVGGTCMLKRLDAFHSQYTRMIFFIYMIQFYVG